MHSASVQVAVSVGVLLLSATLVAKWLNRQAIADQKVTLRWACFVLLHKGAGCGT